MELRHEFTVPVPVDDAWRAFLHVERVAPCLPGASVEAYDDKTVTGSVRVKVGPATVTYKGTAVFEERDEEARRPVMVAGGRYARGQGTARATVTGTLSERDGLTVVTVHTDLTVSGRPAQFGRGVLAEVGERIIGQFAACLAERRTVPAAGREDTPGDAARGQAADEAKSAAVTAPERPARGSQEPLDLLRTAGLPVAARAAAVVTAAVVVAVSVLRIRRRRHARRNAVGGV
ncbi:SRPBCC family protein [Streptomyces sp. NPDC006147]|uniref:SRPBCC family protein n=1 Tax=Streptomyces sp. NPDC006147 TaxID=3155597 RepID=UPI0033BE6FD0